MDVALQRHCAKYIYAIPDGLRELMSDISREVLRNQPQEIYTFIADYLDALMITRENARVAAKTVENITQIGITVVELLQKTGMSRAEADNISLTIQTVFKRYMMAQEAHRLESDHESFEERDLVAEIMEEAKISAKDIDAAATIIQKAFRMLKQSQEHAKDLLLGVVDWRIAARSTIRLYRKTNVSYEEANAAATLIKAAYKGYYTRRTTKRLLEKGKEIIAAKEEELLDPGEEESKEWKVDNQQSSKETEPAQSTTISSETSQLEKEESENIEVKVDKQQSSNETEPTESIVISSEIVTVAETEITSNFMDTD